MPGLILLLLLTAILFFRLKGALRKRLEDKANNYDYLKGEYDLLSSVNRRLKESVVLLEKKSEEIITLYDITRDVCKTLDEDKLFSIFRQRLDKYISIDDCRFIKNKTEAFGLKNYKVLPLTMHNEIIGYLAANLINKEDEDKFHILAQQFLIGLRKSLLYEKVQALTITDSLTNSFTRRFFLEKLNEEIKRAQSFMLKFSFLMIDIDHFKQINDYYGHLVGDAVLRQAAKIIKDNIRQIDFIGRYGGEELSVILVETDKGAASFACERIRKAVESSAIKAYDETIKVTISIGVAAFPDDARENKLLIERSDEALYLAKQRGRNRFCLYEAHK